MATVSVHDRDLTNAQWEILKLLIPEPTCREDGRGRPWKDRRTVLNGILWVLRTGAPWAEVPDRYPSLRSKIAHGADLRSAMAAVDPASCRYLHGVNRARFHQ